MLGALLFWGLYHGLLIFGNLHADASIFHEQIWEHGKESAHEVATIRAGRPFTAGASTITETLLFQYTSNLPQSDVCIHTCVYLYTHVCVIDVNIHAYKHIFIYTHMYIYIYINIYIYAYKSTYICIYICTYSRLSIHLYICLSIYMCSFYLYVCIYIYIYIYIHVYIHIYLHTHTQWKLFRCTSSSLSDSLSQACTMAADSQVALPVQKQLGRLLCCRVL